MKTYLSRDRRHRIAAKSKEVIAILHNAVKEFLTDNCLHLSASISYYMFFCIFPLSLAFTSVLGFILGSPESEAKVIQAIGDFLPVSSEFITSSIQGVVRARGTIGVIATIGLLWGGSAVFNVIRKSLNIAWGIKKPRPFFVERAMELAMTLGVGLLLLTSIGITAALSVVRQFNAAVLGIEFLNGAVFWQASLMLLSISLAFVTFLLLYKFVPYTRVRWRDVWGGALLAAVGFEAAKQIFVWYATDFAHYNLIYGPVGTIIALLIWTYISAVIVLFCAKLTSVYSKSRRSAIEFSTWKGCRRANNRRHSFDHLAVDGASSLHRHN
ncbi:YihY/virulence factor BrkB family protein [Dehalococcoidia bacterium]|nr:YihY/virulence factor BrkB family protein [Dehalococcoidia bacterium]